MNQSEDFLQELIEQLENGKPLEECLADLSPQEAEALQLIAAMQEVSFPEEDEAIVATQEAKLLSAAKAKFRAASEQDSPPPITAVFLSRIQTWVNQLPISQELAYGIAAVLLVLLFSVVWQGLGGRSGDDQPIIDDTNTEEVAEDSYPAPSADLAENPSDASDITDTPSVPSDAEDIVASAPPTPEGPAIYLPLLSSALNFKAETAVIDDIQGIVEIQNSDGGWAAINRATTIEAGQRLRTGELSKTTLTFYDGSQAHLSANTEISIDQLNALPPEEGYRTVVMTQWAGDSDHDVQFRNDGGSLYAVNTPSGNGVARGTKFHVLVTADLLTRYIVTEGKVDVTGSGRTVSVTAGKLSTIIAGDMPADPAFNVSGEGEVKGMGAVWTIAGQTFQTDERTIIIGNPQLGDLVHIDGHLLSDGSRVADRIVLLRRAIANQFTVSGQVETMGASWTIGTQSVLVDGETAVDDDIIVGSNVQTQGIILANGSLQATQITLVEGSLGLPFAFSGVVQAMGGDSWTVSGKAIALNNDTDIEDSIAVGDVVAVRGTILANDTWLTNEITIKHDGLPTFEFTGIIHSITPWQIAGIGFEARDWTIIAPNLAVGDRVRVSGSILSDGTKVATSITPLTNTFADTVLFTGLVSSINPWVVGGLNLVVSADTQIIGTITTGSSVQVRARLLADGTWSVVSVQLLYPNFGHGCLTYSSPITIVNANKIRVKHWHLDIKRDGRIKIHGNIKVDSIITLPICAAWDGTFIVIGDIIAIYQPIVIIIDTGNGGGGGLPPGCKITKKGNVKCSGRGSNKKS